MYYFFQKIFLHFSADKVGKNFCKSISHQTGHLQRNGRNNFGAPFSRILLKSYCTNRCTKYLIVLTTKAFKKF